MTAIALPQRGQISVKYLIAITVSLAVGAGDVDTSIVNVAIPT